MAAIEEYDSYMHTFWSKGTQCLHPKDLEEAHQSGLCVALKKLRPKKECSSGLDAKDDDEARVNEVSTFFSSINYSRNILNSR